MPHIDLAALVKLVGYPGLFTIIYAESGLPIGFFLPGASILFTAGFLASQGILDIVILAPLVAIAAILGDTTGYWLGAKWGVKLFERPDSHFFKHEHLIRTKHFYEKYGPRTVFLGRFVPIVRTFVPILAGVGSMPYGMFLRYNILGGLIWGTGITVLGYFLGESVPGIEQYVTLVIIGIVAVTSLPLILPYLRRLKSIIKSN